MEASKLKNTVVLRNLPSNLVEEAIIILKENKKIKRLEKIEKNKNSMQKEQKENTKEKDYILKEAEMLVNNYISKVENKDSKDIFNKNIKQKYNKIKKYSYFITGFAILEALILIIR